MHRLRRLHSGMPGQRDLRRRRRTAGPTEFHRAERRTFPEFASISRAKKPCRTPTTGTASRTSCNTWKISATAGAPGAAGLVRCLDDRRPKYTRQTVTHVHTWVPDKLFSLRVTRDDAYTFVPGQFARVGLPGADDPDGPPTLWRAYSMVSAPRSPGWSSIPSLCPTACSARAWRNCAPATRSTLKNALRLPDP